MSIPGRPDPVRESSLRHSPAASGVRVPYGKRGRSRRDPGRPRRARSLDAYASASASDDLLLLAAANWPVAWRVVDARRPTNRRAPRRRRRAARGSAQRRMSCAPRSARIRSTPAPMWRIRELAGLTEIRTTTSISRAPSLVATETAGLRDSFERTGRRVAFLTRRRQRRHGNELDRGRGGRDVAGRLASVGLRSRWTCRCRQSADRTILRHPPWQPIPATAPRPSRQRAGSGG